MYTRCQSPFAADLPDLSIAPDADCAAGDVDRAMAAAGRDEPAELGPLDELELSETFFVQVIK